MFLGSNRREQLQHPLHQVARTLDSSLQICGGTQSQGSTPGLVWIYDFPAITLQSGFVSRTCKHF